jgi:hypothetical protein
VILFGVWAVAALRGLVAVRTAGAAGIHPSQERIHKETEPV